MDNEKILLECSCHGKHYFEAEVWDLGSQEIILTFVDHIDGIRGFFRGVWNAWKHRNIYHAEIVVTGDEVSKLITYLQKYGQKTQQTGTIESAVVPDTKE